MTDAPPPDLLLRNAELVATVDDARREVPNGWVAVTGGRIAGVGVAGTEPAVGAGTAVVQANGCLITPGLVNTHHHIYQNLTRAYGPAIDGTLFEWLTALYPLWSRLDEEAAYVSAFVGLAELALGGCTTTTDHLYVHPRGGGDLITAEIAAAKELGFRFHPTRGSMSLSKKDGGLPPDSVVQTDDEILADSERLVKLHHDPTFGAMVRVALAPCSPFSVTPALMRATAELVELWWMWRGCSPPAGMARFMDRPRVRARSSVSAVTMMEMRSARSCGVRKESVSTAWEPGVSS